MTSTSVTAVPVAFVSNRVTLEFVIRVTFGRFMISRMQLISASDFAWSKHGYPSHVSQRTHFDANGSASFRFRPSGIGKVRMPSFRTSSSIACMRGSFGRAG